MTTTQPADQRSRATQIVCALVRDLQLSLSRFNPLRLAEVPPEAVDRAAERVLELLREVSEDAVMQVLDNRHAQLRAVIRAAVRAELDAADLGIVARTGRMEQ